MTVAALILAASTDSALADVEGQPRVRRLADIAWAGGAVPIVVGAPDPDGAVARALAGAPVTYASPAPAQSGPVGQIVNVIEAAVAEVRETDAALVWPARLVWVDPETVTSLIEAHGVHPDAVLRPTFGGEAGWPVLVPLAHLATLRGLGSGRMPEELIDDLVGAGVPEVRLDLGDPGSTYDAETARADLPPYDGPRAPVSARTHEWGDAAADVVDRADADDAGDRANGGGEGPLEGPALAPFAQAEDSEADVD
ncbi:MAG TPA: NTP transferase domain-containing protein [Candidatus Saccharimonadales bacterium]|nr:NTP transferase domain-containing protein [Candidatus Saccharimonadales bacterium]